MKSSRNVPGIAFLCELPAMKFDESDAASTSPFVQGEWTQLAKSGTFFSPVYGKIDLTPADLETMYQNFRTKTPVAPTRLPIDYDHLSDEPKKPGDGQAAGWIDDLKYEPDAEGKPALWMKPSWTKDAAKLIAEGKYAGISPFFITDFLDKLTGKKIGPTLRAAALTNRPFLEGMENIPVPTIMMSENAAFEFSSDPRVATLRSESSDTSKQGQMPKRWLSELGEHSSTRTNSKGAAMNEKKTCACGAPMRRDANGKALSERESKIKWAEDIGSMATPPALTCPHCGAPVQHGEGDHKVSLAKQQMAEPPMEDTGDEGEEEMSDMPVKEGMEELSDVEGEEMSDEDTPEDMEMDELSGDAETLDLGEPVEVPEKPMPPVMQKPATAMRESKLQAQVRQLSERAAIVERQLKIAQQRERRSAAEQLVRQGLQQGKLTPKLIGDWTNPGWALSEAYSRPKAFKEWLRTTAPVLVDLEERGTGKEPENVGVAGTAARIHELAMSEIEKRPGVSYADAVRHVQSQNRSLAEAYDREMSRPAGETSVRALSDRSSIR